MFDGLMHIFDGMVFRCAIDADWTMLLIGGACQALTGYDPDELLSSRLIPYDAIIHTDDRDRVTSVTMQAVAERLPYRLEYRICCRDGTEKRVLERGSATRDEHGILVLQGIIEDISEQVRSREAVASAEARYRSIFENATDGLFQTAAEGRYLAANPALARIYGYASPAELIAALQNIGSQLYIDPSRRETFKRLMIASGRVDDFESEVKRRDGTIIWISESAHSVFDSDGSFLYYEGVVQDITDHKLHQQQLEYQASHDLLTGLPNRTLLADRLQQSIAQADRNGHFAAVAFIDLDNFKYINDSLGHQAGDDLLVEVSRRLQGCLRGTDTVARYGGDEFVLVLNNHYQAVSVIRLMERVLDDIQRPVVVDGTDLFVTPSIGISLYPNDGGDAQTLIKNADAAMYLAKGKGRNNFQFFTSRLNDLAMERIGLDSSLRRALSRNEIQVHFQPKVNRHRQVFGFEALVRWNSPEHGWVVPEKFIGVAEDTGMIVPITEFVLDTACRQVVAWSTAGLGDFNMAVNLSARMLQDDSVVDMVARTLHRNGLAPQRLELEITESMIIGNIEHSVVMLHQLKALGVQLAIDDFGTGYSSLSYLQCFPIDVLKIDRAFVRTLDLKVKESPIAKLVTLLGHSLGLTVVAEGVETESQLEYLEAIGCDAYQGFLFARPMPAGEIERKLLLRDAAVAALD
ncbi:MAG: EAL domain-containing protein [Betaproteobacteria bacterium]|nr:EAL domain-containing protein [Betaproteobacteria bacterium]